MEQTNRRGNTFGLWLDWPFIFRTFRRWTLPIICLASMLMLGTYVVGSFQMHDTCYVSALVAVVPREYNMNNLQDRISNDAVTRNVNMWNSNTMMKTIKDMDPNVAVSGYMHAEAVKDTNLVKLNVQADTAQDAFYLMNGAMRNYRKIVSNFDETHLTVVLTDTIKSTVSVIKPNVLKYAVLVFLATVCGCFGLLGLWTLLTNLLHSEAQAESLLEVPIYESLPKVRKRRKQKAVLITNPRMSLDYLETIDRLASRISQHMIRHKQKTVMITSIQENEGKTTIAANVAISLAQKGNKTLLIDMDFRRPGVVKILDQPSDQTNYVSYALQNEKELQDKVVIREDLGNLHVLFQYTTVKDADQLLETSDLSEQLKKLSLEYDFIIVDTPPMGPVRDADVIAQRVDTSFLVIREERNRAPMVNDMTDQLEEFGAHCMGAVMNRCVRVRKRPHARKGRKNYRNRYRRGDRY